MPCSLVVCFMIPVSFKGDLFVVSTKILLDWARRRLTRSWNYRRSCWWRGQESMAYREEVTARGLFINSEGWKSEPRLGKVAKAWWGMQEVIPRLYVKCERQLRHEICSQRLATFPSLCWENGGPSAQMFWMVSFSWMYVLYIKSLGNTEQYKKRKFKLHVLPWANDNYY